MKIRVISCGVPTYWYAKRIGEVFETDGELDDDESYEVLDCHDPEDDEGGIGYIQRVDCEIVGVTTAELIAQKRKELAELEAELTEEMALKIGDYARVLTDNYDYFAVGDIVIIQMVDSRKGLSFPIDVVSVISRRVGSEFGTTQLERLTPAEAKSALLAQVEALFNVREANE